MPPQMPDALGGGCVQASQQLGGDGQDVVEWWHQETAWTWPGFLDVQLGGQ